MTRPQFLRELRRLQKAYAYAPHGLKRKRHAELVAFMTEHLRSTVGSKAAA